MSNILTVNLPDIGEGVVEGEVIEWLKQVGDPLEQDEPVVQVMTDKATVELPAMQPGRLAKHHVLEGAIAIKDKPLYDIEVSGTKQEASTPPPEPEPEVKPEKKASPTTSPQAVAPASKKSKKTLATPSVRHLARQKKLDINAMEGTGKQGRVTREDIERFEKDSGTPPIFASPRVSTPVHELEGDSRVPLRGLRKIIAERMMESKIIIPHYAYFDEVELSSLVHLRKELKEEVQLRGIKLTYLPFFVKAISRALTEFPLVNSSLDLTTQEVVTHHVHHVGIAVATDHGLIVPVVRDVQNKGILDIAAEINDLSERTRSGKIKSEELKGSTITISNIGSIGGLFATPIINYPEVCILGMTRLQERPVVRNGDIVIRHMMNLSWSFDHRVVDGAIGALFSNEVIKLLESPAQLLLQHLDLERESV